MKFLLLAVLLLCFGGAVGGAVQEKMTLIPIGEPSNFAVAILFPEHIQGDQAIVRIFYEEDAAITIGHAGTDSKPLRLMRIDTFVIPVVPGTAIMSDAVPVPRERVKKIEVTVVSNGQQQTFEEF